MPGAVEFVTNFDSQYLFHGLALAWSLHRVAPEARLTLVGMDERCVDLLHEVAPPTSRVVSIRALETPQLRAVKPVRNAGEYCWTCKPTLIRHVLDAAPEAEAATYLDSDLFFYAHPSLMLDELRAGSVLITAHRFPSRQEWMTGRNGRFNAGWLSFRRDRDALRVLDWWHAKCIEWCYAVHEPHRYGDQKYLDDWPERFAGVRVLQRAEVYLAPWNVGAHALEARDGGVWVDGRAPLCAFHFQGLKVHAPDRFTLAVDERLRAEARALVFAPYLEALQAAMGRVWAVDPQFSAGFAPRRRGGVEALKRLKRRVLGKDNLVRYGSPARAQRGAGP